MAKLTTKQRNALPDSAFAIPSRRAYPIHDKAHRDNAKARVTQHGSPSEKKTVRRAVAAREGGKKK